MPHQLTGAAVRLIRGRGLLARGDYPGALRAFTRALALDPACGAAALNRAAVFLLLGDEAAALSDCRSLSRMGADVLVAYQDLSTPSALEHPRLAAAAKDLTRRRPSCAWAHVLNAFTLRGLMRYDLALVEMGKALSLEPGSAALWALRSRLRLSDRGAFDGVGDLDRALSREPRLGWLHCWRGEALRHNGKLREALKALNQGLALNPGYQPGYAWRGGVLRLLGRPRRAIVDLTQALRKNLSARACGEPTEDQKSWVFNQRMLCWRAVGKPINALIDMNSAHALNPRYEIYYASDVTEASVSIESLIPSALYGIPKLQAHAWKGKILHRRGDRAGALRCYQDAFKVYPKGWIWTWAGELLLEMGQPSEALPLLDRAVREEPRYAPAWSARAGARRARGDLRGALTDFSRAVTLDIRSARAWAGRGECRKALGDRAGAAEDMRFSRGILSPR